LIFKVISSAFASVLMVSAAAADCVPEEFSKDWLKNQESLGGRTLKYHVGLTMEEMEQRLNRSRRASGISSYHDFKTANYYIQEALNQNRHLFNVEWEPKARVGAFKSLDFKTSRIIGWGVYRDEAGIIDLRRLRVVMKKTAPGECMLWTSYPIR
jgi:hypothetical protein